MDWSNSRYVRLYRDDTADWMAMCWQARALLPLMLRKCDRSGVVQVRPGPARARLVGGLVGLPVEVVEAGLADLLVDGCLVESETGFVFRNFITAQEATASNKLMVKESRQRRKEKAIGDRKPVEGERKPVTSEESERKPVETDTPSRAVLRRAEPKPLRAVADATSAAVDLGQPTPFRLEHEDPSTPPPEAQPSHLEELRDRLAEVRLFVAPGELADDHGFLGSKKQCNSVLGKSVRWLAEKNACADEEAKALMRQGCWLYCRDAWPGRMGQAPPYSLWVFLKRKHLGNYTAKARAMEWEFDPDLDRWQPKSTTKESA